jgi:hypothetical protein
VDRARDVLAFAGATRRREDGDRVLAGDVIRAKLRRDRRQS